MVENRTQVNILPAGPDQLQLLRETAISAYLDHFRYLWFDEGKWYIDQVYSENKLLEEMKAGNNFFWLAYLQNKPIGFLQLRIDRAIPKPGEDSGLVLEKIYLRNTARALGIGKKFIQLASLQAKLNQKSFISLKAMDSSHDSIEFYKKMQFEISGSERLNYELMKPEYRGMVTMKKWINH